MDEPALRLVREAMASALGVARESVRADSRREDFAGWDSLGHLNLIMELEARFGRSLSLEEALGLESVSDILRVMGNA